LIWTDDDTIPRGNPVGFIYEDDIALLAQLDVPNKLPVIDGANNRDAVTSPTKFVVPDTINPLPVTNNDPVTSNPFGKLIYPVKDDAVAAVVANDAEVATEEVPNTEPVNTPMNEPVNDPVLICLDDDTVPAGKPEGITYDELTAFDAVPVNGPMNNEADTVVASIDPVTINPAGNDIDPVKYDAVAAVVAKDAVAGMNVMEFAALAVVALFAQLAVPNIVPTFVILLPPNDKSPLIARVPFTNKYCVWSSALNPNKFP